jgi:PadR family transcriptional regulator, regulatory protein PadR
MVQNSLYKGSLSTIVLKLLNDNDRMYGYQITCEVEQITSGNLKITEGALYPVLHKLEAQGLLSVELVKVNNRPHKYYFITEKGKKEIAGLLNDMKSFIQNLGILLNPEFT